MIIRMGAIQAAEQILYGHLHGREPVEMTLDAHAIVPSRLGLDDGYYEDVEGYSGGSAWVVELPQLPEAFTADVDYRCDADRDALLTLFAVRTEGNPAQLIVPETTKISYAPERVQLVHDDQPFSVLTDRLAAIVQLLGPGGDWHYLAWASYGKEQPDHYLVYALPGSGDFRKRCAGIVRLS